MAYLQNSNWRERPGAVAGVIVVHGLIGYALVAGLDASQIVETVKNPQGIFVPEVKLPPPPPRPQPTVEPDLKLTTPPAHAPSPPLDLSTTRPAVDVTDVVIPQIDEVITRYVPGPTPAPEPAISPRPAFDPVSARPRNDPGSWVTEADYRSSWINREMVGTARFRLEIGAGGKVEQCTITGSSGYPELDRATCDLVTRRARFDAAKDVTGARTSGTYASSVRWQLPD